MIEKIIEASAKNKFLVFLMVFFLSAGGIWALKNTPLDAVPDLSDVQVIVYTTWMGRNPTIMEDQVTYPIVTAMISAPKVKFVRGFSDFGFSYVYIIFEDGTDIYWARSRVLEYMNQVQERLPTGVTPTLGPDATGVGWVFQYALVDKSGTHDLAQLRSLQDWTCAIKSVPSKAWRKSRVGRIRAPVPGEVRSQQTLGLRLPVKSVVDAIRISNNDIGGRSVELSGAEYMVRGRGYIKSDERHREDRRGGERAGHADPGPRHRPGRSGPGYAPRLRRIQWLKESGGRHRGHPLRRERAEFDRTGEAKIEEIEPILAGRRKDRRRSMIAPI